MHCPDSRYCVVAQKKGLGIQANMNSLGISMLQDFILHRRRHCGNGGGRTDAQRAAAGAPAAAPAAGVYARRQHCADKHSHVTDLETYGLPPPISMLVDLRMLLLDLATHTNIQQTRSRDPGDSPK